MVELYLSGFLSRVKRCSIIKSSFIDVAWRNAVRLFSPYGNRSTPFLTIGSKLASIISQKQLTNVVSTLIYDMRLIQLTCIDTNCAVTNNFN